MRCSNINCGKEGDVKFCEECGAKMVEEKMNTVVVCSGKSEVGSTCGAELLPAQKFCWNCGTKVDQSLFRRLHLLTCPQCDTVFQQDRMFCTECGYNLKYQQTTGETYLCL